MPYLEISPLIPVLRSDFSVLYPNTADGATDNTASAFSSILENEILSLYSILQMTVDSMLSSPAKQVQTQEKKIKKKALSTSYPTNWSPAYL